MEKAELEKYIEQGLSGRAIALRVNKSVTTIRYWLTKYELSTGFHEHINWDINKLKLVSSTAQSKREILYLMGLRDSGSIYSQLNKIALENEITLPSYVRKEKYSKSLKDMFKMNSNTKGITLRNHMVKSFGIPYQCSSCGLSEWLGKPITIEVEHKDGNHTNNEIDNLCFLCPNCHSQTETYGVNKNNR